MALHYLIQRRYLIEQEEFRLMEFGMTGINHLYYVVINIVCVLCSADAAGGTLAIYPRMHSPAQSCQSR